MKTLTLLSALLLTLNAYSLTEDYILYGQAEVYAQKVEAKKEKSKKEKICEKYGLSSQSKEACLNSKKSLSKIEACMINAKSALSQSYCLITKNLSNTLIKDCQNSTSSEQSEVACLFLAEKKKFESSEKIISCGGLGAMEEINCLKFQR